MSPVWIGCWRQRVPEVNGKSLDGTQKILYFEREIHCAVGMRLIWHFLRGIVSLFSVTTSPLYRYPYWNSAEGLIGDWNRIGRDIESTLERKDD